MSSQNQARYKKKHKQTRNLKISLNLNNKSKIQAYIADSWRMISKSILNNIKVISDKILSFEYNLNTILKLTLKEIIFQYLEMIIPGSI